MHLRQQKRLVRVPLEEPPVAAIPARRQHRTGHPARVQRHILHAKLPTERTRVIHRRISHEIRARRRNDRIPVRLVRHELAEVERHVDQRVAIANPVRVHAHVQLHIVNGAIHPAAQVQQLRPVAHAARQIAVDVRAGAGHRTLDALHAKLESGKQFGYSKGASKSFELLSVWCRELRRKRRPEAEQRQNLVT